MVVDTVYSMWFEKICKTLKATYQNKTIDMPHLYACHYAFVFQLNL